MLIALAAVALALALSLPGLGCNHESAYGGATAGATEAVAVTAAMVDVSGNQEDAAAPCCDGIRVAAHERIVLAAAGERPMPSGVSALAFVLLVPVFVPRRVALRQPPLRGSRSFYLRSARILR